MNGEYVSKEEILKECPRCFYDDEVI